DAGTFDDPFVGRGNITGGQLGGQFVVGNDPFRQEAARTGDHSICHCGTHQTVSPAASGSPAAASPIWTRWVISATAWAVRSCSLLPTASRARCRAKP